MNPFHRVVDVDDDARIRQAHDRRYLGPDMFDWITGPGWPASYEIFRDRLAEELARQDGVRIEQANQIVKQGFWRSLASALPMKWRQRYADGASVGRRWRRITAELPGARAAWHGLQARLPGASSRLSLACLSAPSSRYGREFAEIRRAFESSAEEALVQEPALT